jgi:hypothetical protein
MLFLLKKMLFSLQIKRRKNVFDQLDDIQLHEDDSKKSIDKSTADSHDLNVSIVPQKGFLSMVKTPGRSLGQDHYNLNTAQHYIHLQFNHEYLLVSDHDNCQYHDQLKLRQVIVQPLSTTDSMEFEWACNDGRKSLPPYILPSPPPPPVVDVEHSVIESSGSSTSSTSSSSSSSPSAKKSSPAVRNKNKRPTVFQTKKKATAIKEKMDYRNRVKQSSPDQRHDDEHQQEQRPHVKKLTPAHIVRLRTLSKKRKRGYNGQFLPGGSQLRLLEKQARSLNGEYSAIQPQFKKPKIVITAELPQQQQTVNGRPMADQGQQTDGKTSGVEMMQTSDETNHGFFSFGGSSSSSTVDGQSPSITKEQQSSPDVWHDTSVEFTPLAAVNISPIKELSDPEHFADHMTTVFQALSTEFPNAVERNVDRFDFHDDDNGHVDNKTEQWHGTFVPYQQDDDHYADYADHYHDQYENDGSGDVIMTDGYLSMDDGDAFEPFASLLIV